MKKFRVFSFPVMGCLWVFRAPGVLDPRAPGVCSILPEQSGYPGFWTPGCPVPWPDVSGWSGCPVPLLRVPGVGRLPTVGSVEGVFIPSFFLLPTLIFPKLLPPLLDLKKLGLSTPSHPNLLIFWGLEEIHPIYSSTKPI